MSEDLKSILQLIPSLIFSVVLIYFGIRAIGGWRGIRTPRILGPALLVPIGMSVTVLGESVKLTIFGLVVTMVGMTLTTFWTGLRYIQLHRVVDRLDPYVDDSNPLPLPADDAEVQRDLTTAARLLADPALAFRYGPEFATRVTLLRDSLLLPGRATPRD